MIERVYDEAKITPIVMTMFDDMVEDDTRIECFDLDVNRDCWLSIDDYKALFHVSPFNRTTLNIHCYVTKGNRVNAVNYGKEAVKWVKENAPSMYKKLITQTPFRHIKIYVLKLGFELEGVYKKAFTKGGEQIDLSLFGLDIGSIK